jgi:aminoglycoside phosphotransferase (APT) family kinase protein
VDTTAELQKITQGATAEIFVWDDKRILKLFFDWMEQGSAQREADVTNAVIASGFPAPKVYEVVMVDGREGIVYDRIDGKPFLQILEAKIWQGFSLVRRMADLHTKLHTLTAHESLPSLHQSLERKITNEARLSDTLKSKLLKHLAALPDGDKICHGDFHVLNILDSQPKPTVIDWVDAKRGHPYADVARTVVIHTEHPHAHEVSKLLYILLPILQRFIVSTYLRRYCELTYSNVADIQQWIPIMAAARLRESSGKHDQLMAMIQQWDEGN